ESSWQDRGKNGSVARRQLAAVSSSRIAVNRIADFHNTKEHHLISCEALVSGRNRDRVSRVHAIIRRPVRSALHSGISGNRRLFKVWIFKMWLGIFMCGRDVRIAEPHDTLYGTR